MNKTERDHILTEAYADLAKMLEKRIRSGQIRLRKQGKQKAISVYVPPNLSSDIFHNAILDLLLRQEKQPEFIIDDISIRPVMQGYFTIELLRYHRRASKDQSRLQPLPQYRDDDEGKKWVPDIKEDEQAYAHLLNFELQRDLARHIEAVIPPDWVPAFLQHVVFDVPVRTVARRLRLPVSTLESRFRHFKQELRKALSAYACKRSEKERSHDPQYARIG